ncbi:MAG: THxN family PEP-CTERM protein [Tateyamaria sp.]|uniref:THxN family PEP-CTERM protein n=1 Tax=Tateyamaria sp. TaxID=1929288 RepID=UPI0032A0578D
MKFFNLVAASVVAGLVLTASAFAAPISIVGIDADWTGVTPLTGITVDNSGDPVTMRWGSGNDGPSGYDFDMSDTPIGPPLTNPILLGSFTHHNNPITGTTLLQASLDVVLTLTGGLTISRTFDFTHDETPNRPALENCKYPSSGSRCDDLVTVSNTNVGEALTIGGVGYILNIIGFSEDNGVSTSASFQTIERGSNVASLYASIDVAPVPLPAAGWMLIAGMGGLVAMRRRKSTR